MAMMTNLLFVKVRFYTRAASAGKLQAKIVLRLMA
jgi:hypothetical protein